MSTTQFPKLNLQTGCINSRPMARAIPEYDKKLVGTRIIHLRVAKNDMAQKTLAAAIGINPQKLWNYESGTDALPVEHAAAICTVTGANFDYLYRGILGGLPPDLIEEIIKVQTNPPKKRSRRA